MTTPRYQKLIPKLDAGHYLISVDQWGKCHAMPISTRELKTFISDVLGREAQ